VPRFAANLSMLFGDVPPLQRPMAARRAGFAAVEMQFPYEIPVDEWVKAKHEAGVDWVLLNLPAGNAAAGDRGLGALPGRQREFRDSVALCRRYGEALGAQVVNCLSGCPPADTTKQTAAACMVENMGYAAEELAKSGMRALIEPINNRDIPGFFVTAAAEAVDLIGRIRHPNVALLHDLYHAQVMVGNLIPNLERLAPHIGHIQFADTPGRHEPGTGELNFPNLFRAIDRIGYTGWVSAEYRPSGPTEASLAWLKTA
jgi:hydroxypyruvate isomerase